MKLVRRNYGDIGQVSTKNEPLVSQEESINHKWTLEKSSRDADIAVLDQKSLQNTYANLKI